MAVLDGLLSSSENSMDLHNDLQLLVVGVSNEIKEWLDGTVRPMPYESQLALRSWTKSHGKSNPQSELEVCLILVDQPNQKLTPPGFDALPGVL